MAYYPDLSPFVYGGRNVDEPEAVNVGWLSQGQPFPVDGPCEELLDKLWSFCKVAARHHRGLHNCEFCPPNTSTYATRKREPLLLGYSEIRAFGMDGIVYAAPSLIYHYVLVHHYQPPEPFIRALFEGPAPPDFVYFARLDRHRFDWHSTSAPAKKPGAIDWVGGKRVEIEYLDAPLNS